MSKNITKNLPVLIALYCSSKARKKELMKHLKLHTIKVIYECTIGIINKNIKVKDQEKRKTNRNDDKIRELVIPKSSQKKRKEMLVQEEGVFLAPLFAPIVGSLVDLLLNCITGG